MASPQSELLFASIQHSRPDRCVRLSHNPSVHVYYALKSKIENSDRAWLEEFLELDGLDALLDSLVHLSGKGFMNISDSVLQLDCIACVKAILNTKVGLLFTIGRETCVLKLTSALDTPNTLPKKQICELLTAVALHSERAHQLVLQALQQLAKRIGEPHAFSLIVRELKQADTAKHRTSLLGFINTLVGCGLDARLRCRTRNQFIALGLLDIIQSVSRDHKEGDLAVQIEVFEEQKHRDEQLLCKEQKLDVQDRTELFTAISDKLIKRPEATDFLHILQDLYLLDNSNCDHSLLWQTMSKTVQHVANLKGKEETDSFLHNLHSLVSPQSAASATPGDAAAQVGKKPRESLSLSRKHSDGSNHSQQSVHWRDADEIITCSPDIGGRNSSGEYSRRDSGISLSGTSPFPVEAGGAGFKRQGSQRGSFRKVPQLEKVQEGVVLASGPVPRVPVKPLKWVKLPARLATRDVSIWRQLRLSSAGIKLDYTSLEQEYSDTGGIQDADDELELLSGDHSLAINMLLARLETTPEELASCVGEADDTALDLGGLRCLLNVLPDDEEICQLKAYRGPRYDLAPAEQFLLYLSDIPDYRILLGGMLFRSEFGSKVVRLRTMLQAMTTACRDVLNSPGLRDFVKTMVEAGNFLNANTPYGNAAGVKLDTWRRLVSVKGKSHHTSLLETLIQQLDAQNDEVLLFVDDFPNLEQAAGQSLDGVKTEVTQLGERLKRLLQQLSGAQQSVRDNFDFFIEDVKQDLQQLHDSATRVRSLSNQMALYFCENEATFDLQTCLKQLLEFCDLVRKCRQIRGQFNPQVDGQVARQRKLFAEQRRVRLEEECIDKQVARLLRKKVGMCSSFVTPQTDGILDQLLSEVNRGNCQRFLGEELCGPSNEDDDPLLVSHIAHEEEPPSVVETPFLLNEIHLGSNTKTYADRADAYILPQYRRETQINTASYLAGPGDNNPPRLKPSGHRAPTDSPEIFKIKFYPRLCDNNEVAKAVPNAKKKTHKRSNSDLDKSTVAEEKWKHYERQLAQAGDIQKVFRPESSYPVVALGLETQTGLLQKEEVWVHDPQEVEQRIINMDQNVEQFARGKKKRSSFGMLKRFVLGRRDSNIPEGKPVEKDGKSKSRKGRKGDENIDLVMENAAAGKQGKLAGRGNGKRLSLSNKENAV